ncbi:MAG: glycosyl hydrolase [Gammaproteobacteria bacterium]
MHSEALTTLPPTRGKVSLLIATAKGAFILVGNPRRSAWTLQGTWLFGQVVNHVVRDHRDGRTLLVGTRTGHLGPTVLRSEDNGKTWEEARRPPAFRKARGDEPKRVVEHTFWLTPGHPSEPRVWYCGTVPVGLFRSEDGGVTWRGVAGFNDCPDMPRWGIGSPPGGPFTHSVLVDPCDPKHLYLGLSTGGVFESRDRGKTWTALNRGVLADFLPDPYPEFGHDPHCVVMSPADPNRLYQQNHCGIYRLDRPGETWERIGVPMPKGIGDIGFPIAAHPRDPDTLWVFPMDGTRVWPRTSPDGKPAAYRSRDAGRRWVRQDRGFPNRHAWFTVYRQALAVDRHDPVGVYLGTTGGEIWASRDEGERWAPIARHLPKVLAVEVG